MDRPGSPSNRFIASITIRPSSDPTSASETARPTGRSAITTTSASATAAPGSEATAPGMSASAVSVLVLSGSRTPNTTSCPAPAKAAPSPPPTFPAPMIAIRIAVPPAPGPPVAPPRDDRAPARFAKGRQAIESAPASCKRGVPERPASAGAQARVRAPGNDPVRSPRRPYLRPIVPHATPEYVAAKHLRARFVAPVRAMPRTANGNRARQQEDTAGPTAGTPGRARARTTPVRPCRRGARHGTSSRGRRGQRQPRAGRGVRGRPDVVALPVRHRRRGPVAAQPGPQPAPAGRPPGPVPGDDRRGRDDHGPRPGHRAARDPRAALDRDRPARPGADVRPALRPPGLPDDPLRAAGVPATRRSASSSCTTARDYDWTADELELCTTFANQMAIAVANARLFNSVRAGAARLRAIQELSSRLNRIQDVGGIGEAIVAEADKLIGHDTIRVYRSTMRGRVRADRVPGRVRRDRAAVVRRSPGAGRRGPHGLGRRAQHEHPAGRRRRRPAWPPGRRSTAARSRCCSSR